MRICIYLFVGFLLLGCGREHTQSTSITVQICNNATYEQVGDSALKYKVTVIVDSFSHNMGVVTCSNKILMQKTVSRENYHDTASFFVESEEWTIVGFNRDTIVVEESSDFMRRKKITIPKKTVIIKFKNVFIRYSPQLLYNRINIWGDEIIILSSQSPYV